MPCNFDLLKCLSFGGMKLKPPSFSSFGTLEEGQGHMPQKERRPTKATQADPYAQLSRPMPFCCCRQLHARGMYAAWAPFLEGNFCGMVYRN